MEVHSYIAYAEVYSCLCGGMQKYTTYAEELIRRYIAYAEV